jgi:putative transposase
MERLRACHQRTDLLAGFFASTGMTLDPEPP